MKIIDLLNEKLNRTGSNELVIFDIDDTLLHTTAKINVIKDGKVVRSLTNQEFNNYKLGPGEEFDFGEFRDAAKFEEESVPIGPMLDKLRSDLSSGKNVVMLTARADFDNQKAVWRTFKRHGIDINRDVHLYRAGNQPGNESPAIKKAIHVNDWLKTGKYNKVVMYDDSEKNLTVFKSLEKRFPDVSFEAHHVSEKGETRQIESWSNKYKRSINCNNPKGFSQRAHCQGRKKNEDIDIGREWMSDTELDDYIPLQLQDEWRELLGYDEEGNPHPLWVNMTGDYEPNSNDPQHRVWMVKVANKWLQMKKIPNVKFYDVRDIGDELEWEVQIGPSDQQFDEHKKNESVEPNDVHKLANKKKVSWDNDPNFLALSKKITGVSHLDQMNQSQLKKMLDYLKALEENGDEGDEVKFQKNLIPMPKGTVKVDVSDTLDWYNLGMNISDLDDADPREFGKGPPQTVIAFGSEPEEHRYLKQLKRLGLPVHDIDENFADGRNPQDKGDSKRHGINTKASVSSLRKTAKQGGRKGQLAHWLANMKSGRAKANKK